MDLAPGTPVTDNVRLVELLGEGGMGSVWIAEHRALNTQVAVKFVSAELVAEDPSMVERFTREASLAAQIKSPYVVQTYDHGVMDDLLDAYAALWTARRIAELGIDRVEVLGNGAMDGPLPMRIVA